jgi:hypothetical protein
LEHLVVERAENNSKLLIGIAYKKIITRIMALLTGGHHDRQNVVIYNAEVHSHRHAYQVRGR